MVWFVRPSSIQRTDGRTKTIRAILPWSKRRQGHGLMARMARQEFAWKTQRAISPTPTANYA
jgi:hypothetical protein